MQALQDWLKSIGLQRLEGVLVGNGIDVDVLHAMTEADLETLGLSMGDRKRMMLAITALRPIGQVGEHRQLTIMFCDLVDSTALCERLGSEQWRDVVLAYQQTSATIIERFGGAIAQYLGDGLLVYFGYPQAHEDAPERAIRSALAMVDALTELRIAVSELERVRLSVRIGIHTGLVVIGDMGAGQRREQLALGDTPNLAARLQGLAEPNTVVISDSTLRLSGGGFQCQDMGMHVLKGVREPRQIWRVISVGETRSRFDAATMAGLSPLVGRQQELTLLTQCWHQALLGHGQVVMLSGEAGMGKSRLLKELRDRLGNAGLRAMHLQCSSHQVHSAFHPNIAYLECLLGFTRDQPISVKLDRLDALVEDQFGRPRTQAALLASMLSIPGESRYEPLVDSAHQREQQTIAALIDMVVAESQRQPMLLILEDVHWADPATLNFLQTLVVRARHMALLVVVTYRPEFQPSLDQHEHVTSLAMSSLDPAEVAALVARLAGELGLSSELTQQIVSKTDGVPLFVEELTKSLLEVPTDANANAQSVVPATLRDSLAARLDRSALAKEIAQIGSILGREFSLDWLKVLSTMSREDMDEALAALTQSGLAIETARRDGTVYTFKHAMVQDVAYDSLLKLRRQELHAQVVRALEERFTDVRDATPELLARHAAAAGLPAVAIPYWRKASDLAMKRLALSEAVAHLTAGLVCTQALSQGPQRDQTELQLQASVGTVHMLGKGWAAPEVAKAYARANELADAADKVEESIWPLWGVCVFQLVRGEIAQGQAIGRRMMTVARQANSRTVWLVANMMHLQLMMYSGQYEQVARYCEQVDHRYRDPQDRALISLYSTDLRLVSMVHGSQTRWIMGDVADAAQACADQEAFARALNHPYSLAWALTWGAMSYLHRGDVEGLLQRVQEGQHLATLHGFAYVSGIAVIAAGWARVQQGALGEGIEQMQLGLAQFEATGAGIAVPFFKTLLADALGCADRQAEGLLLLDQAWQQTCLGGERWYEAELHRVRGRLLSQGAQSDVAQARLCFKRAVEVATEQQAHSWRLRAEADLASWLTPGLLAAR